MSSKCPICKKEGVLIPNITVKAVLKNNLKDGIGDADYYLCVDKKCKVSYFNEHKKFGVNDTKQPIWYKEGADPKMVCYCNNITEQEVMDVILEEGITSMNDVFMFIKGEIKSNCKYFNPTGKCCTQAFKNAKDKAIAFKNNEEYSEPDYHA